MVSKRGGACVSYNHVYSLAHLLRVIKLPATVQLVVGPKPRNYWPELASNDHPLNQQQTDHYLAGVFNQDNKTFGSKSNGYFGSFTRSGGRNSSVERNRRHHSKSLSEATFTAVLRLEDIRVTI